MAGPKGSGLSLGRYISRLNVHKNTYLAAELKQYGIGPGQYGFLMVLYRKEGLSQDEITSRLMVDKATTTRAVSKLEVEGYVRRENDPDDRRVHRIFLTEKGLEFESVLKGILKEWIDGLTRDLTHEEKDRLICLLDKLERNMEGSK